eukprot:TRINITY_DN4878_c0_g1_i1.p1 TRINITY_DN4878_c0_g1~~TRINITY_DN4878_c0_g1_i1.p1  ORF type:complete len:431 (+),score=65.21 TRINITY_DN4878_c0_g1_i1:106-1398(+)
MVLRHILLLSFLKLAHATLEGALGNACEADAVDSGHGSLALLQSEKSRRAGSAKLAGGSAGDSTKKLTDQESKLVASQQPLLTPIARTFISSDPKRSADWWLRYLTGTKRVESWLKADPSCQETDAIEIEYNGEKMSMIFIKDRVRPYGKVHPNAFAESSDREWEKIMDREMNYSPWVDFHDGLTWSLFNADAFTEDNVKYQRYSDNVLRLNVPETAWTLELVAINYLSPPPTISKSSVKSWIGAVYDNPDLCRHVEPVHATRMWWKATFAAVDPPRAVKFAEKVLGAYHIESPYPWPPEGNCTAALWARLPTADGSNGIEFHFVESPAYPQGNPGIADFHKAQRDIRDLDKGTFDQYLYNSMVLKADSLDPFIDRLRSEKTPFLLFEMDHQKKFFSLFFSFPGNEAIVIQIQASEVTKAVPKPYSSCTM